MGCEADGAFGAAGRASPRMAPMTLRFAMFFAVLSLLLAGMGAFVHRRARAALGLGPRASRALAVVIGAGIVAFVASRALGRVLPEAVARGLGIAGMTIGLSVLVSGLLLFAGETMAALVRGAARAARRLARSGAGAELAGRADAASSDAQDVASTGPSDGASDGMLERMSERTWGAAPPTPEAAETTGSEGLAPIARRASHAREATGSTADATKTTGVEGLAALPRRAFLARAATGSTLLIASGSSLYGALVGRHDYEVPEVAVPIPGLPRALDGYAIAQISDVHLGLYVGEPEVAAAEDLVRRARADLVVLTGDLVDIDSRYAPLLGRMASRLAALARDGVVAVPGNHDYYAGLEPIVASLREAGATVLRNGHRVLRGGIALVGADDVWGARLRLGRGPDLARATAGLSPDLPRILLCHNPSYFAEAAGEVALQLSGHTHGGQVNLLVRPADWVLPHGWVAGLYERAGSRLYVNRGFGTAGPPVRVGAPPEVTRIVLVAA